MVVMLRHNNQIDDGDVVDVKEEGMLCLSAGGKLCMNEANNNVHVVSDGLGCGKICSGKIPTLFYSLFWWTIFLRFKTGTQCVGAVMILCFAFHSLALFFSTLLTLCSCAMCILTDILMQFRFVFSFFSAMRNS